MDSKELLKIGAVLFLYGVAAPVLGVLLWKRRLLQKAVFAALCFMILGGLFQAADWGFTLSFFEYRGHAKGYHFYFADILALALIIGRFLDDWRRFRWFPPGLWLYLLYCALSLLSIVSAPAPSYVLMAAFKTVKMSLYFIAAFNFVREEEDLQFLLQTLAVVMGWEMVVVLKMKYVDGIYQVPGTFDHQNPLSMFATMIGLVFLAITLGPPNRASAWCFFGYLACAVIQQATLSRAGVVVYAVGTLWVAVLSLLQKVTRRRVAVLGGLVALGLVGLTMTIDTIIARFHDYGNEASTQTRVLLNEASSRMLADYPLGIGWNNFALTINKPWPYGRIIDDWQGAAGAKVDEDAPKGVVESLYWLLLSETGYQGFAGFLLFIALFLWWNLRGVLHFRYHFLGALSLGIGSGCAWNYAHSLLERVLTQYRNMMLWMILLAVTARIDVWRREQRRRKTHPRLRSASVLEESSSSR